MIYNHDTIENSLKLYQGKHTKNTNSNITENHNLMNTNLEFTNSLYRISETKHMLDAKIAFVESVMDDYNIPDQNIQDTKEKLIDSYFDHFNILIQDFKNKEGVRYPDSKIIPEEGIDYSIYSYTNLTTMRTRTSFYETLIHDDISFAIFRAKLLDLESEHIDSEKDFIVESVKYFRNGQLSKPDVYISAEELNYLLTCIRNIVIAKTGFYHYDEDIESIFNVMKEFRDNSYTNIGRLEESLSSYLLLYSARLDAINEFERELTNLFTNYLQ